MHTEGGPHKVFILFCVNKGIPFSILTKNKIIYAYHTMLVSIYIIRVFKLISQGIYFLKYFMEKIYI